MRILAATALAATSLVLLASPASAHAELVPWQLPPGATAGLTLLVTHGCGDEDEWLSSAPLEEEPTVAITVEAPLELTIEPGELDGWTLDTERDATGRVTRARWDSDDPAGTSATLQIPMDVTVAALPEGSEIWLPVIQDCAEGDQLAWTLESDLRGGDEVPAMRLLVSEDATAPPPSLAPEGGTLLPRLGPSALALAVGLGALGYLLRRRRAAPPSAPAPER